MKNSTGFSILELMVVLTLVGAAIAFTGKAFQNFIMASDFERQAREFWAELSTARTESCKKNTTYIVTLNSSTQEMRIYADINKNNAPEADELQRIHSLPTGIFFSNLKPSGAPDPPSLSSNNWLSDNIYLTNDNLVNVNAGKVYLLSNKVTPTGYCLMRATNSVMLDFLKWDGTQWTEH